MSRRRRGGVMEEDALDLFLDAISNVFGGILFIALAVIILLQFTVPKPAEPAEAAVASGASTASEVQADAASALSAMLLEGAADAEGADALERRDALRSALAESSVARRLAERRAAAAEEEQRLAAEAALDSAERLAEVEERLLEAEQTLEALRARPTQRVRAGRFRPSGKAEVPLMVDGDRVVALLDDRGEVDRSSLVIDAAAQTARPRAGAGVGVGDGGAGDRAITAFLAGLDARRQYLNVAVWPGGFGTARRLRDVAIELGFEFTLTPVAAGQGVPFNAASGVQ